MCGPAYSARQVLFFFFFLFLALKYTCRRSNRIKPFFISLKSGMKWHESPSMCVLTLPGGWARTNRTSPIFLFCFFFFLFPILKQKRKSSHYQLDDVVTFETRQRQQGGPDHIPTVEGERMASERGEKQKRKAWKRYAYTFRWLFLLLFHHDF